MMIQARTNTRYQVVKREEEVTDCYQRNNTARQIALILWLWSNSFWFCPWLSQTLEWLWPAQLQTEAILLALKSDPAPMATDRSWSDADDFRITLGAILLFPILTHPQLIILSTYPSRSEFSSFPSLCYHFSTPLIQTGRFSGCHPVLIKEAALEPQPWALIRICYNTDWEFPKFQVLVLFPD